MQVQRNYQGSRGISDQAMIILNRTWKHKLLPPNIKTFIWESLEELLLLVHVQEIFLCR
jgi:hypothetical protein